MRHQKREIYEIYKDGVLLKKCWREDMLAYLNIEPDRYYRNTRKGNNIIDGYRIERITVKEQREQEKKDEEIKKQKEETPFGCIVRLLKENGNTNLIKEDLKYVPKLKELFNIEIQHFPPSRQMSLCLYGDEAYSVEDWIVTWVDYGRRKKHD